MSVMVRGIASVPVRTSTETWRAIVDLLAPAASPGRDRLLAVTNVAAILIAEEYIQQAPIVVAPAAGARVRVRTVHGADAVDAQADEIPLAVSPCAGTAWTMSLPCGIDDVEEIRASLSAHSWITVRDVTEGITTDPSESSTKSAGSLVIDYEEMGR